MTLKNNFTGKESLLKDVHQKIVILDLRKHLVYNLSGDVKPVSM